MYYCKLRWALERLENALKCKEVWVEGSYDFRNPSEDLPSDWSDEQRRTLHYQALGKPLEAQDVCAVAARADESRLYQLQLCSA